MKKFSYALVCLFFLNVYAQSTGKIKQQVTGVFNKTGKLINFKEKGERQTQGGMKKTYLIATEQKERFGTNVKTYELVFYAQEASGIVCTKDDIGKCVVYQFQNVREYTEDENGQIVEENNFQRLTSCRPCTEAEAAAYKSRFE